MNKMYVLDAEHMKNADDRTITELGIDQEVLMERAALVVVRYIKKHEFKKVLCVCGIGNNGGDALAVARILLMQGMKADVFLCGEPEKQKCSVRKQYDIFCKVGGRTVTTMNFSEYDMIIDGIFGIGISRPIEGWYAEVIEAINRAKTCGSKVIAVDIPSGVCTDTGAVPGVAVCADETVAFAYYKPGHLLYPGAGYCGTVHVEEIGISHRYFYNEEEMNFFTLSRYAEVSLPKRKRDGNKGTFGRVLVIAGSASMYGACYLSALAALRTGSGLVEVYTHESNRQTMQTMLPEGIMHTCHPDDLQNEKLCKLMERCDCVIIGPGLSTDDFAMQLVRFVFENCTKTIVADADALNCIARSKDLLYNQKRFIHREVIITPHPGELSGLTGMSVKALKEDYVANVRKFAKEYGLIVVGKDAGTVVSDGEKVYINQTGSDGMATAGSGDVLSGIIGALCAQKEPAYDAAWKGVFLHGKAGDVALEHSNQYSLLAGDIANALAQIL